MILNTNKSLSITCTLQKAITSVPISIKGDDIEEKTTAKLLGVTYDNHTQFASHVDNIISNSKPAFHAIIKLKKEGLNAESLALFYRARILSILSYTAPSWFPFIYSTQKTSWNASSSHS